MREDNYPILIFGSLLAFMFVLFIVSLYSYSNDIENSPSYIRARLKSKIDEIKIQEEIKVLRKELDELQNN